MDYDFFLKVYIDLSVDPAYLSGDTLNGSNFRLSQL